MCSILGIETKSIPEGALREAFDRTISRGPDMSRIAMLRPSDGLEQPNSEYR